MPCFHLYGRRVMPGVLMLVRYFVLRSVACALVSHTCRPRAFWRRGRAPRQSGGYSGGVPPLPIPNREVKPVIADGTAMQCGRVGSRLLLVGGFPETQSGKPLFFVLVLNQ